MTDVTVLAGVWPDGAHTISPRKPRSTQTMKGIHALLVDESFHRLLFACLF